MNNTVPVKLKTEYSHEPLGIEAARPRLSWVIQTEARGYRQGAFRVLVARSEDRLREDQGEVWDSGRVDSDQSVFVEYNGSPLQSGAEYFWKVMVWDANGQPSAWSEPARWTMGLLKRSDWRAEWISLKYDRGSEERPASYFRKTFEISKPLRRAVIYATAMGAMELRLNGARVGDDHFAPEWTDYNVRIHYRTYEVTKQLQEGGNAIGGIVGDGWYCGYIAWYGQNQYGEFPRFMLQLNIEYEDGTTEIVPTDMTWKAGRGPIRSSDILMGEHYDARLENDGWDSCGYDDSEWRKPQQYGDYKGWLTAQSGPPIRITEQLEPVSLQRTEWGTLIADMGQNMVGWARVTVSGAPGDEIVLRYAEILDSDGKLYTENLRSAKQTDRYVLRGGGDETYEPFFTFHGFRYVEISGGDSLDVKSVTGQVIHNAMARTGSLTTSDARVNRLADNIYWTQRANFITVPTDCPQRDERLGWTGDAQIFSRTATYNMDVSGFMDKFMTDMVDAQRKTGAFTDVVPFMKGMPDWSTFVGSAGWADAGVVIPWTMYHVYEDRRLLEKHYEAMADWVRYLHRMSPQLLREDTQYYGDWLSLNADTPKNVFATAYFAYSVKMMSNIAGALGKTDDAAAYEELFGQIRQRFTEAYVGEDGKIAGGTQTAYAMALYMELLPQELRAAAAGHLVKDIEERGWHISTGIHGIKYLLPALCDAGYEEAAYRLLLQDTYPSWLYSIRHGATTIWERWDGWTDDKGFQTPGMNSFNHYALGAVGEWMYRYLGGIDTAPDSHGYRHIQIRPVIREGLTRVDCTFESSYGPIGCSWSTETGILTVKVTVPANTNADICLPCQPADRIEEKGTSIGEHNDIADLGMADGRRILRVGSGDYHFQVRP